MENCIENNMWSFLVITKHQVWTFIITKMLDVVGALQDWAIALIPLQCHLI